MASSDEDRAVFLTQNKSKANSGSSVDTDDILSGVLDLVQEGCKIPGDFDLNSPVFTDVDLSDEELLRATQLIEQAEPERFAPPLAHTDLADLVESGLSKKTENKTKWAISLFEKWQQQRMKRLSAQESTLPSMDLLNMTSEELGNVLSYFIAEVRNMSGGEYKPNTLYEIIIAIQHHLRKCGKLVTVMDDPAFEGMRRVLDAKMKCLSKQGIGLKTNKAEIITECMEDEMWKRGILGFTSPQQLLDTLVYQLGLHFALRAGQEHRGLRVGLYGQIHVKQDFQGNRYLEYEEDVSKTNPGGIQHRKVTGKVARTYENKCNGSRCPVKLFEKYMSLRPTNGKCDALYLRPLKNPQPECWYSDCPIGVHVLQQTVRRLCESAGFRGYFTNHSLRATAATRLYTAGVDEQLISEKTGHRSNAVRGFKRTSDEQLSAMSDILQCQPGPSNEKNTKDEVPNLSSTNDQTCPRELNIESGSMSLKIKF